MKKTLVFMLALFLTPGIFAQNWSKDLEKKAKKGDVTAQYEIGVSYLQGNGTEENHKKAAKFLYMATSQGHAEAKNQLLTFYSKELEKLAEAGDADAQFELGQIYYTGKEVYKNTDKAAEWYFLAMQQGHLAATNRFFSFDSKKSRETMVQSNPWGIDPIVYTGYSGTTRFSFDGDTPAKDPYCKIIIGRFLNRYSNGQVFYNTDISMTGSRNGNVISNALVEFSSSRLYYYGNVTIEKNDQIILHKGGFFVHAEYSGEAYLKEDLKVPFGHSDEEHGFYYSFPETYQNLFFTSQVHVPADKVESVWNNTLSTKFGCPTSLDHDEIMKFAKSNSEVKTLDYEIKHVLITKKNRTPHFKDFIDSIHLGDQCYLTYTPKNGYNDYKKGQGEFTYKKGKDYMRWGARGGLDVFAKTYDDCVIRLLGGVSTSVKYNNGDRFSGSCDFGRLSTKGGPRKMDAYHTPFALKENELHETWNAKNAAELKIAYQDGVFTDKTGKETEYSHGVTKQEYERLLKEKEAARQQKIKDALKLLKDRCKQMVTILIQEGYRPQEVRALIEQYRIYPGMSAYLIERAIELQGNVLGSVVINPSMFEQKKVITIYNSITAEVEFQQVVQYNKITGKVASVSSSF